MIIIRKRENQVSGAWSCHRRLLSTYTGPLYRLQNKQDGTQRDFWSPLGDVLKEIEAWAPEGATTVAIYNQGGVN